MTVASGGEALRAVLYLRVSTARQAEHDVSIPDQHRQGEAWCAAHGYELVEAFVDAGASATSDRRPEFQRLIEAASERPAPFDIILVHSFSRFFRDHFELEFHIRKLARNGVKLISITQEVGDDPTGHFTFVGAQDHQRSRATPLGARARLSTQLRVRLRGADHC